jgi:hypothetical protein
MSDAVLRNDFDACVTLYQDFIKQTSKAKSSPTIGISEFKTSAGLGSKRKQHDIVEDRYYTKSEYATLTGEQKKALAERRLQRGHKPGSKGGGRNNHKPSHSKGTTSVLKDLKAVKRGVAQLTKHIKKDDEDDDKSTTLSTDSSASASEATTKKQSNKSNRNHTALTRQSKRSK